MFPVTLIQCPIFEQIHDLQRGNPASPLLIERLYSKDPVVRRHAAYALSESGDPGLIPHIKNIAEDRSGYVRKQAVTMGFSLPDKNFAGIREVLVSLLSDPFINIRTAAAFCFARRKDPVCALPLLELVQNDELDSGKHSGTVQAIQNLTGSSFGYSSGPGASRPQTPGNKKATRRFAAWIEKNIPDAGLIYKEDKIWTREMLKKKRGRTGNRRHKRSEQ